LSRLLPSEYGAVRADPRFLKLVDLARGKLEARPKEMGGRHIANMLNGE
jgi:hypothetical protein